MKFIRNYFFGTGILLIFLLNSPVTYGWVDIAYYRFEEGAAGGTSMGPGSVKDSSGNGLNGSGTFLYSSNVAINPIPQTYSQNNLSLQLSGLSSVRINDNPLFQLTNSLSLEAFFYPLDYNTHVFQQFIIFRGDQRGGYDPYFLMVRQGCFTFT
jgi:hypothetical protein